MDDIRTTRTTPGFLAGRLLGILDHAKHDILLDTDRRFEQIYQVVWLRPTPGLVTLCKEWDKVARRLRDADPKRCADLDRAWTWIMAHLDTKALVEEGVTARGNAIIYGHAVEKVYQTGSMTAETRKTADDWVARAKATAAAAVRAGMSESEAARLAGLSRLTVRSALGK